MQKIKSILGCLICDKCLGRTVHCFRSIFSKSKANGFEAHHMVEETETKSFVKDSNSPRNSSDTTDVESTGSRRKINNENNTINYFSMTEEDITKERNKIKDDADDLFKDINSKERVNLRRSDDHGWDEDELNIMI